MTDIEEYLIKEFGVVMTPQDIAKVLHRHPTRVRALCQDGTLPAVRIGGRWHVPTAKMAMIINGGSNA